MDDYLWVLKSAEKDLMREVEPERLNALDEEELLALHKRVRKARNKHVKNARRKAAAEIAAQGDRGLARKKGAKSRVRAEAFEEALAVVSARLAEVAHARAEALKQERLARAAANQNSGPDSSSSGDGKVSDSGRTRSHEESPRSRKRDASWQAEGARKQAKRDSR
ncbi:hypothetical protein LK09_07335 [Microbacterium mangrovi]|uniref:Uncharacterized protein n=1 Tax=Microbacterium mangrovi TaxID=1348253 RepID=A0A0B2AAG5_9MICO|nr:hypothetical protein [Microbacterium mangrovi]KHK98728.1 hypothetical protein LK09_07335 [Microbacterium mangrovi]